VAARKLKIRRNTVMITMHETVRHLLFNFSNNLRYIPVDILMYVTYLYVQSMGQL